MTRFGGVSVGSSRTRVVRFGTAAGLALVLGIVPLGTSAATADDATPTTTSTTTPPPTPSSTTTTSSSSGTSTTSPTSDATTSTSPTSTKTTGSQTSEPLLAPQAAAPDAAAPQVVPVPTGNDAVITVKVGGDRTTTAAVAGLAGVTLTLYDGVNAPTTPATDIGTNTCVSDADGDCSWIIPNTESGGANRDRRFWVVQTGAPTGWLRNSSLITGPDGGPFGPTDYRFRTGASLVNGTTYSSGDSFMVGTGNSVATASGGIWQNTRVNPVAPTKCGLNVALVLDLSGSVTGSLPALKTAAKTFTNSLVGTPSRLGLFTFAATAPANPTNNQNRPLTPVSTQANADLVNGWIDNLSAGGTTNWDRGIFQVQQSASQFDIAIVITDGNPTVYGNTEGPGAFTRFREVENGIFSANAVKAENTRMIAFGVGAGISSGAANLAAISGPTANSDYFQTSDYAQVGSILKDLALGSCQGSVTVVKQVVPSTAPVGSITGAVPAGGWTFGATTPTTGVTIAPPSGSTAPGTGAVNFALTFPGGTTTAQISLTETPQSGFALQPVDGANAVCTRPDTGATVPVTSTGTLGFTVGSSIDYGVTCTVYNRAVNPPAEVVVNKQWRITDTTSGLITTYVDGTQPSDLQAALTLNGSPLAFGTTRTGFVQGDTTAIAETVTNGLRGCVLGTPTLVRVGDSTNLGLPYTATLAAGTNYFLVTNPVTCTTRLTLVKTVTSGPAAPTAWNLSAAAPPGAASGPAGTTGVTALVTPGARYTLAEEGGDPRYVQRAGPNAVPIPGSTGSWECVEIDANGNVVPGFADGLNGGVIVFIGLSVRCTAVNDTAQLLVRKTVVNDNGGTATPEQWSLTATPQAPVSPGITATTVPGSTAGASIWLRPGQAYLITETGPGGYTQTSFECTFGQTRGTDPLITLAANDLGDCTFTNDDQPATLTLLKTVTNDNGGTALPTAWTLSATGPSSFAPGPTPVSRQVNSGSYTLSESGGPSGYTAGAWTCPGYTVSGSTVTVPYGANVVCTINNDDILGTWTISKGSDPVSGTTVHPGDVITYTVTARKLAGVDPRNVVVSDDLSNVVNNATLVSGPTPSTGTATVTGTTMTWTIPDLSGTQTVTYQVKVNAGANGVTIGNVVTSPGSNPCVPESTEQPPGPALVRALLAPAALSQLAEAADCTATTHDTPAWSLAKSSNPASGSLVPAGSTITYTLLATNTYGPPVTGAVAIDDLSAVLAHGTLVAVPDGATLAGTFLTWPIPTLNAKGDSETLTYQVRLNSDAYDVTVKNVATPGPGGTCTTCTTNHPTPPQGVVPPDLPLTGADLLPVLWWAALLMLLGTAALVVSQRRRAG